MCAKQIVGRALNSDDQYSDLEARYQAAVQKQLSELRLNGSHKLLESRFQLIRSLTRALKTVPSKFIRYMSDFKSPSRAYRLHRKALILSSSALIVVILLTLFALLVPSSINYVYANKKNCTVSPSLFPSLSKIESQGTFSIKAVPVVSLGHTEIFSYHLCAQPINNPVDQSIYINRQITPLGFMHISKDIMVTTGKYLSVAADTLTPKARPIIKPLSFTLAGHDSTFKYAITANGHSNLCSMRGVVLSCSLTPLDLSYSSIYQASLERVFNGRPAGAVLTKDIKTITATAINQSSIAEGSIVYDKPQQITLTTNKTITKLEAVSLTATQGSTTTNIPITYSFSGQDITVDIANPLPRQESLDLHVANIVSNDNSTLTGPYDLTFTTSGGPQVSGSNIPTFGLASGQTMTVDFNQPLMPGQNPSQFVSLLVNGIEQPATVTANGQQISITPTNGYPVCATVQIKISSALQSNYGISGNSAWSYDTRSHCYTTFSIGTSVEGRPITAYQFGSGPSMVLYIAAMEGNEQNSANLLQQWIPDVDANPGKIPSYRTLVIIPQINPDGYAADTRLNADGIDLNRNFPANNWQEQVTEPTAPTVWTNDGGPYPLSEPESQALASYYEAHRPRLTLTMHSHGGIVEPNDAGDSIALGARYASLADYDEIPTYAIGNFFDYTTTGAFEDWANNKLGLPVLEVELESATSDEYSRNLPALWAMAQVSE